MLFAIPWHGATIVGTTDEPVDKASTEPRALNSEKRFLLDHITRYLGRKPRVEEILSVWSGLRPLVKKGGVKTSEAFERSHHPRLAHRSCYSYRGKMDHLSAHGTGND